MVTSVMLRMGQPLIYQTVGTNSLWLMCGSKKAEYVTSMSCVVSDFPRGPVAARCERALIIAPEAIEALHPMQTGGAAF